MKKIQTYFWGNAAGGRALPYVAPSLTIHSIEKNYPLCTSAGGYTPEEGEYDDDSD